MLIIHITWSIQAVSRQNLSLVFILYSCIYNFYAFCNIFIYLLFNPHTNNCNFDPNYKYIVVIFIEDNPYIMAEAIHPAALFNVKCSFYQVSASAKS